MGTGFLGALSSGSVQVSPVARVWPLRRSPVVFPHELIQGLGFSLGCASAYVSILGDDGGHVATLFSSSGVHAKRGLLGSLQLLGACVT